MAIFPTTGERRFDVCVVGAGPVGLTSALVLARAGLRVQVFEQLGALSGASLAATFHPSTLDLLDELGVMEGFGALGRVVSSIQWRDRAGALLGVLDYALLADATRHPYRLHAEQADLTPLLLAELRRLPNASVRFNSRVTHAEGKTDSVRLRIEAPGETFRCESAFVVAADGARSGVRAALGVDHFEQSYPSYAIRVITDTDLAALLPGLSPLTYIRDVGQSSSLLGLRDHWRVVFRVPGQPPDTPRVDPHALLARSLTNVTTRLAVRSVQTYRLARGVLGSYRAGRVVFVGDAAHITSTAGGFNMNCGIHDAVELGSALASVLLGDRPDTDLTRAADRRRSILLNKVIPRSEKRVAGVQDPASSELGAAIAELRAIATDPILARRYLIQASLLDCAPNAEGMAIPS